MKGQEIGSSLGRVIETRPLPEPYVGYALCRVVMPGETESGIAIPETVETELKLFIVKASEGHYLDGTLVPCTLQRGDRVHLAPQIIPGIDKFGKPANKKSIRAIELGDGHGKEYRWIMLLDVIGFERKAATH